jgi:hypothetical protein
LCFEDEGKDFDLKIEENDFIQLYEPYEVQLKTPVYKVTSGLNFSLCITVTG